MDMKNSNERFDLTEEEIEAEYQRFMEIPECDFEPSPRFRRRLLKIKVKKAHKKLSFPKGTIRRIASVAAAFAIFVAMGFSANALYDLYRGFDLDHEKGNADFVINVPENVDPPKSLEKIYCLGELPEGYMISQKTTYSSSHTVYYNHSEKPDVGITFKQLCLSAFVSISTENVDYEEVNYNGYKAIYRYGDEYSSLNWVTEEYHFSILIYENCSVEYLFELANGIIEQK